MRLILLSVFFIGVSFLTPVIAQAPTASAYPTITITPSINVYASPIPSLVISPSPVSTVSPSMPALSTTPSEVLCSDIQVDPAELGFGIPSFGDILTFLIRGFFTIAGLAALFMLLMGAFAWVTSGGAKDAVEAAQKKITAAIVGMIMIVVVLAIVWTLEQIVFAGKICFGLSCPVSIPTLVQPVDNGSASNTNCITGTPGPSPVITSTPPISGNEPVFNSDPQSFIFMK